MSALLPAKVTDRHNATTTTELVGRNSDPVPFKHSIACLPASVPDSTATFIEKNSLPRLAMYRIWNLYDL